MQKLPPMLYIDEQETPLHLAVTTKYVEKIAASTPNNSSKIRNRSLYTFRKKQLDIEEKRVQEIELLRKAVTESNEIQRERNELLKKLINSMEGKNNY